MEHVLQVENLCKNYPGFELKDVSLTVEAGKIMGLIGRNGAGKTTTIKSILGLVHPANGNISFFGQDYATNEQAIKMRIGYTCGGMSSYPHKTLAAIIEVVRRFYPQWDQQACQKYLELWNLDPQKKRYELSAGMQVKFDLVLALSHRAEFLLLDEPTSGLDPVSREELLEVFLSLASQGCAILFSTHITSDLDKCADKITYIRQGQIVESVAIDEFSKGYRLIKLDHPVDQLTMAQQKLLIGVRPDRQGFSALVKSSSASAFDAKLITTPGLEDIMVHFEAEGK